MCQVGYCLNSVMKMVEDGFLTLPQLYYIRDNFLIQPQQPNICSAGNGYCVNSVSRMIDDGFLTSSQYNDDGQTFLICGLVSGNLELVRLLIREKNFDVNGPNHIGETPLALMILSHNVNMVVELLNLGANVNLQSRFLTSHGPLYFPLRLAFIDYDLNSLVIVQALLEHGADLTTGTILITLQEHEDYDNVCFRACVLLILEYGIQLTESSDRLTLYKQYFMFCQAIVDENIELVKKMIIDISDIDFNGVDDLTPSWLCAHFNKPEILKILIENGADLSRGNYGIYYIPTMANSVGIAEVLIQHNFLQYFNQQPRQYNMVTFAFEAGCIEIIQLLFKYNIISDISTVYYTPLHWASTVDESKITGNHKKIFEHIIKSSVCDINAQTIDGSTALYLFTKNYCLYYEEGEHDKCQCEVITMFLEHGADPRIATNGGRYPWHDDCQYPDCSVLKYFEKMFLLDESFAKDKSDKLFKGNLDLKNNPLHDFENYQKEVEEMNSIKISHRTVKKPPMSILGFLFLEPTFAARYALNEKLNKIYKDNNEDFKNRFPHYGFALNFHLLKGFERSILMKSAQDLLEDAWNVEVPSDITDSIFQYMSNKKMKAFFQVAENCSFNISNNLNF